jgi:hypothetical protein
MHAHTHIDVRRGGQVHHDADFFQEILAMRVTLAVSGWQCLCTSFNCAPELPDDVRDLTIREPDYCTAMRSLACEADKQSHQQ